MKNNRVLLFKDFHTALPEEFISYMLEHADSAIIYNVRGKNDFNRWELWVRTDLNILNAIAKFNEESNNSLDRFFTLVITEKDPFTGWIECDELGQERWIAGA